MKPKVYALMAAFAIVSSSPAVIAQTSLAPDQNPDYMISQNKYLQTADSVNALHSTTAQETYKAIDYLEDKKEARELRKAYRRELRMEQARNRWSSYYYPYNGFNNYYPYRYRGHYFMNNYLYNTLPLALTLGLWCR